MMVDARAVTKRCVILGAGGHAKVLIDCMVEAGEVEPYAIVDPEVSLWGTSILGSTVVGGDDRLPDLRADGVRFFAVSIGSLREFGVRERVFEVGRSSGLSPITIKHPSAVCSAHAQIAAGCQLLPLSIINAGAILGANVLVNSGGIVEHDCKIDDHAHIAPGARLSGDVHVGASAHIGIGASVRQGIRIGEGAVIGAGAVVVKDVAPGETVFGVPAKPYQP